MARSDVGARPGRVPTGVEGLDALAGGGLPRGRTSLFLGAPGTGKTVLALQTLLNGASRFKEPGIFVCFEEPPRQLVENAASFGWKPGAPKSGVHFLDARLSRSVVQGGDFDLLGLLSALGALQKRTGAKRVVFDGVDVLLGVLDDPAAERREIYRIHDWLMDSGLTGIFTAKAARSGDQLPPERSFMEYMTDCTVSLHHRELGRSGVRGLRVVKYRGGAHSSDEVPLVISDRGIEVVGHHEPELSYRAYTERVSSGVRGLDEMLGGGYFRGASMLISGAPGTAKSTLAGAFLDAACRRGDRSLYVSLDEAPEQIVRNLRSVGVDLGPHKKSGLLGMLSTRTRAMSAIAHVQRIVRLIEEHDARAVVIDPISALELAGGPAGKDTSVQLLDFAKSRGVTILSTSLLDTVAGGLESTAANISTISDTWIHLSYLVHGGERNRALTIVKSRGMKHSNQMRELILGDEGVKLTDVYTAEGEVLMGTLRWQKEEQERRVRQAEEREGRRRRLEVEQKIHETERRVSALQQELDAQKAELELGRGEAEAYAEQSRRREQTTRVLRSEMSPDESGRRPARQRRR